MQRSYPLYPQSRRTMPLTRTKKIILCRPSRLVQKEWCVAPVPATPRFRFPHSAMYLRFSHRQFEFLWVPRVHPPRTPVRGSDIGGWSLSLGTQPGIRGGSGVAARHSQECGPTSLAALRPGSSPERPSGCSARPKRGSPTIPPSGWGRRSRRSVHWEFV